MQQLVTPKDNIHDIIRAAAIAGQMDIQLFLTRGVYKNLGIKKDLGLTRRHKVSLFGVEDWPSFASVCALHLGRTL